MLLNNLLAVAAGGAVGSIGRHLIALAADQARASGFPLGTFIANIVGCLLIGLFWSWFDRVHISHEFRLLLFTGFLGGFTTFSTFARESLQLFRSGEPLQAMGYILASNVVGIVLVAAGFLLADRFFKS
jgi:CrcB protein